MSHADGEIARREERDKTTAPITLAKNKYLAIVAFVLVHILGIGQHIESLPTLRCEGIYDSFAPINYAQTKDANFSIDTKATGSRTIETIRVNIFLRNTDRDPNKLGSTIIYSFQGLVFEWYGAGPEIELLLRRGFYA